MLMNPTADAAVAAPRTDVGIGQNAGMCPYMTVPIQTTMITTGTTGIPVVSPAANAPSPSRPIDAAAWANRSPVLSECQPLNSMPASPNMYGTDDSIDAQRSERP